MKIRAVGTEMFHADTETDGRTDMTKLMIGFRNFANAPNSAVHTYFKGLMSLCILHLQVTKPCNDAVCVFKYLYSLKMTTD